MPCPRLEGALTTPAAAQSPAGPAAVQKVPRKLHGKKGWTLLPLFKRGSGELAETWGKLQQLISPP